MAGEKGRLKFVFTLPLIDEGRSYRNIMMELLRALPANANCVAGSNLGDAQRVLLDYDVRLTTKRMENREGAGCQLLLVQGWPARNRPFPYCGPRFGKATAPATK